MGFSMGVIAIKGNHLDKADMVFGAFGYADISASKVYNTWAEAALYLSNNYFDYTTRDVALRGIWTDNGWTLICDPEMVDLWQDDNITTLAAKLGTEIWTLAIQTTSASYAFSKFNPQKMRCFFVTDGEVTGNEGTPLPEETGLKTGAQLWADDIIAIGKKLGFNLEPHATGLYTIKHLPYGDEMRAKLAAFESGSKQEPTEKRPWWKIW